MTESEMNKLRMQNTIYWLAAIAVPIILHFGLSSTRFPWPIILPFLLGALMIASNNLLAKAGANNTCDSSRK